MGTFTVGSGQMDITPRIGCHVSGYFNDRIASVIHDPLYAKAIAISDGVNEIGLITLDLIYIPQHVATEAKRQITALTGLPTEAILISATHTHTGPATMADLGTPEEPGYNDSLIPKIVDAFLQAHKSRVPAEIAHASGDVHEEVHNRRWYMKDGSVKMNPGYRNPDAIKPAGPTDPQLGLLIARDPETKQPLALYANLALHYVGVTQDHTVVSADYFEAFATAIQRIAGASFMVMMANGTEGNINNCDFARPARRSTTNFQQIERVANVIAAEAWKAWNLLRDEDFKTAGSVGGRLSWIRFHSRRPTAEELQDAKRKLVEMQDHDDMEYVYAMEIVGLEAMPSEYDVPVQSLRVGDLGVAALCGEVFVEFGLAIKADSPFPQTMVVGLANGCLGYVATDQALDEGSYETRLCRQVCSPKGTGQQWVDAALKDLNTLHG